MRQRRHPRRMSVRRASDDHGFTLVELLVVVIILGILAAVVVFGVSRFRENAVESSCKADVKQVTTAALSYVSKYQAAAPSTPAMAEFLQSYPSNDDYTVTYAPGAGSAFSVTATKSDGSACGTSSAGGGGGPVATTFAVAAPATATAGTAFNVTVTAESGGSTDTSYTGSKTIVFTGPANSPSGAAPTYPATVNFVAGVGTANVTLTKAETVALTATEGSRTGQDSIAVAAGNPRLAFASTSVDGTSVTCSPTTATDAGGNNDVFRTKVSALPLDAFDNPVTLPASGSISVALTLNPGATAAFDTIAGTPLSVPFPGATSTTDYTMQRSSNAAFTGTLTASVSGYVSTVCALDH